MKLLRKLTICGIIYTIAWAAVYVYRRRTSRWNKVSQNQWEQIAEHIRNDGKHTTPLDTVMVMASVESWERWINSK